MYEDLLCASSTLRHRIQSRRRRWGRRRCIPVRKQLALSRRPIKIVHELSKWTSKERNVTTHPHLAPCSKKGLSYKQSEKHPLWGWLDHTCQRDSHCCWLRETCISKQLWSQQILFLLSPLLYSNVKYHLMWALETEQFLRKCWLNVLEEEPQEISNICF